MISTSISQLVATRDAVAPTTELALNEFIPFNNDWCDVEQASQLMQRYSAGAGSEPADQLALDPRSLPSPRSGGCPNWQDKRVAGIKANRQTLGWNSAAACFAYGYGRLAQLGYKFVGADQLIGGPWPDNEPAVSSLDWTTGQPNAKYWAISMLAKAVRAARARPRACERLRAEQQARCDPPPPPLTTWLLPLRSLALGRRQSSTPLSRRRRRHRPHLSAPWGMARAAQPTTARTATLTRWALGMRAKRASST